MKFFLTLNSPVVIYDTVVLFCVEMSHPKLCEPHSVRGGSAVPGTVPTVPFPCHMCSDTEVCSAYMTQNRKVLRIWNNLAYLTSVFDKLFRDCAPVLWPYTPQCTLTSVCSRPCPLSNTTTQKALVTGVIKQFTVSTRTGIQAFWLSGLHLLSMITLRFL